MRYLHSRRIVNTTENGTKLLTAVAIRSSRDCVSVAKRSIYLDTYHEESWAQIQEMESRVAERPPSPEMKFPPPTFTQTLQVRPILPM